MDTSDKYIEMCRKATKIQDNIPRGEEPEECMCCFYCQVHNHIIDCYSELADDSLCGGIKPIWLPLQGQLYELHSLYDTTPAASYLICRTFGIWLNSFGAYIDAPNIKYQLFESIEQLLLAFVMEDINKRWDGSDWGVL